MLVRRILFLSLLPALLVAALFMGMAGTAQAQGTILYVDRNAGGVNNGSSWANAFTSLQGALAVVNANPANSYEVWVATGVYTPAAASLDSFRIERNNVQIYGGFAATETLRTQRDWSANLTILSGDIDGNDGVSEQRSLAQPGRQRHGYGGCHYQQ